MINIISKIINPIVEAVFKYERIVKSIKDRNSFLVEDEKNEEKVDPKNY